MPVLHYTAALGKDNDNESDEEKKQDSLESQPTRTAPQTPGATCHVSEPVREPHRAQSICVECVHHKQKTVMKECSDELETAVLTLCDCLPRSLAKLTKTSLYDVSTQHRSTGWYSPDVFVPRVVHGLVKDRRVPRGDCRLATAIAAYAGSMVLVVAALCKC